MRSPFRIPMRNCAEAIALISQSKKARDFFDLIEHEPNSGCMFWMGAIEQYDGYGAHHVDGRSWRPHRLAYTMLVGPIGSGFHLHHTCGIRCCVNPDHIITMTASEHASHHHHRGGGWRGGRPGPITHCKRGHEFTPENTYTVTRQRYCLTCLRRTRRRGMVKYLKRTQFRHKLKKAQCAFDEKMALYAERSGYDLADKLYDDIRAFEDFHKWRYG